MKNTAAAVLALSLMLPAFAADTGPSHLYRLEDLGARAHVYGMGPKGAPVGDFDPSARKSHQAAVHARGQWHPLENRERISHAEGANRWGDIFGHEIGEVGYRPARWTADGRRHLVDLPDGDFLDLAVGTVRGMSHAGVVAGKYSPTQK